MSRPPNEGMSSASKGATPSNLPTESGPGSESPTVVPDTNASKSIGEGGPSVEAQSHNSSVGTDSSQSGQEPQAPKSPTPEIMLRDLGDKFNQLASLMNLNPATAKEEFHAAALPSYQGSDLMKGRSKVALQAATKEWTSELVDEVEQAFKTIDVLQDTARKASSPTSSPPSSAPSSSAAGGRTSNQPDFLGRIGSLFQAFVPQSSQSQSSTSPSSNSLLSPQKMMDMSHKSIVTNPVVLQLALHQLGSHMQQLPPNEPLYLYCQSICGLLLLHLYELTFKDEHLYGGVGATSMALSAVDMTNPGSMLVNIPTFLRNWAYGQRLLAQEDGDISKLDAAVALLTTTWNIYKDIESISQHAKGLWRSELGACLLDRYSATGAIPDLNDAIEHLQTLSEQGHMVPRLGLAYYERFLHLGKLDDLDRALHYSRTQFIGGDPLARSKFSEPTDYDEIMARHLYGLVLAQRFNMTLDTGDLDRAVESCRNALTALSPSHPMRSHWQADLAWILFTRHEARDEPEDLQSAKEMVQTAIQIFDSGPGRKLGRHTRMPHQAIYGYLLCVDGQKSGDVVKVEEGTRLLLKSRKNFSGPPFLESRIEYYISEAYLAQFKLAKERSSKLEILSSIIHHATLAFNKASENSPQRYSIGLHLGNMRIVQYEHTKVEEHLHDAIAHLCTVALSSTWPSIRLEAAVKWADVADLLGGDGTIGALEVALDILPSLAWAGNHMPVQFRMLQAQQSRIASRAVVNALDAGDAAKAVRYLEQGRNIIWAQSLQLRSNQLTTEDRRDQEQKFLARYLSQQQHASRTPAMTSSNFSQNLAEKLKILEERGAPPEFQNLLKSLEAMHSQVQQKMVDLAGPEKVELDAAAIDQLKSDFTESYRDASLHNAARRWQELQKSVEEVDGMLSADLRGGLSTNNTELMEILQRGSIVILNIHGPRCDAIVISASGASIDFGHLPLKGVSGEEAQSWAETIRQGLYDISQGDMVFSDFEEAILIPILQGLWNGVAHPVLEFLKERKAPRRVWWYPTGSFAFLPIHAASPCEGDEPGVMELAVSSYIPSIHSLLRAHRSPKSSFHILAVGQPHTPGFGALAFVQKELNAINNSMKQNADKLTRIVGNDATTYVVMKSLPEHTAFHYAGHASQNEAYPFHSAFHLHDGPFQLSKLMNLDLSRMQFAYLSACLTSTGDFTLPDECIHLAAGMQFAGVRSLIATTWSVEDRAASMMTSKVYKELLKDGLDNVQAEDTAEALHQAILSMKESKVPLTFLVPFIHLGV